MLGLKFSFIDLCLGIWCVWYSSIVRCRFMSCLVNSLLFSVCFSLCSLLCWFSISWFMWCSLGNENLGVFMLFRM